MGKSKKMKLDNDVKNEMETTEADQTEVSQLDETTTATRLPYEEQVKNVTAIASPLADKKLAKRLYKLIKKASQHKEYVHFGIKNIPKLIKKGASGIVVFAGDVTPIDVMSHIPAMCEEKSVPYIYTPSKQDLGLALGKQTCVMVLIKEHQDYKELYETCYSRVKATSISVL